MPQDGMIWRDRHLETAESSLLLPEVPSLTFMQECHHRHHHTVDITIPYQTTGAPHFHTISNGATNNATHCETFYDRAIV